MAEEQEPIALEEFLKSGVGENPTLFCPPFKFHLVTVRDYNLCHNKLQVVDNLSPFAFGWFNHLLDLTDFCALWVVGSTGDSKNRGPSQLTTDWAYNITSTVEVLPDFSEFLLKMHCWHLGRAIFPTSE